MFKKYGEVGSVAELNAKAEELRAAGDAKGVKAFAVENGLDEMDAEDYLEGETDQLATPAMAAVGRLKVEEESYKEKGKGAVMEYMAIQTIRRITLGNLDVELENAIMKKGKRMEHILGAMRKEAEKHKSGNMGVSCGTDLELLGIIRAYYLESESKLKTKIKALYTEG